MTVTQRNQRLALSAVLIVGGMLIVILHGDSRGTAHPDDGTHSAPLVIGGSGVTKIPLAGLTGPIAVGEGGVWLARHDGAASSLVEIDPTSNATLATLVFSTGPTAVATGEGSVWAVGSTPMPSPAATGTTGAATLVRIGPKSHTVLATVALPGTPGSLTAGLGGVWVGDNAARTVTEFDPHTLQVVATVEVPAGPTKLAAGLGALWATLTDGSVVKIDPSSHTSVAVIRGVKLLSLGRTVAWVQTGSDVERLDPATNHVIGPAYRLHATPACIATGSHTVWLSTWFPAPGASSPQPGTPQDLVFESLRIETTNLTALTTPVPIDDAPTCPAAGFGALWAPSSAGKALLRMPLTGPAAPTPTVGTT